MIPLVTRKPPEHAHGFTVACTSNQPGGPAGANRAKIRRASDTSPAPAQRMQKCAHRIAAVSWSSLGRSIQIELALKEERRKNCRDFLKVSRAEYDRLLESSPGIDQDIIALFNKKFDQVYPHVTKPIICNGLQEVKVYQDSVSMGGEEESAAENAQP